MSQKIIKLEKVGESVSMYRYDNGWMFEVSGRNKSGEYKSCKIVCNTEDELIALLKEYNSKELDN